MRQNLIIQVFIVFFLLLSSCSPKIPSDSESSVDSNSGLSPSPIITPTSNILPVDESLSFLIKEDFEKGKMPGEVVDYGEWKIEIDKNENRLLCNYDVDNSSNIYFGYSWWENYSVEVLVEPISMKDEAWMALGVRFLIDSDSAYVGTLGFGNLYFDFLKQQPYHHFKDGYVQASPTNWYKLRLEVFGHQIKYFINDQLVGEVEDSQFNKGTLFIRTSPHLQICLDNIRVWMLTDSGEFGQAPESIKPNLEVITDSAATGDGGNAWGGHQTRIVHTKDGVFTAYTGEGSGYLDRKWKLTRRQEDGTWSVIAEGIAGREPVNLLTSPDGALYIVGWPDGVGTLWSGKPVGDQIIMVKESIPGMPVTDWPYSSAGIDSNGNVCVLASEGGQTPGGVFHWSCYLPAQKKWIHTATQLDYKFAYTYVFPQLDGELSIVSTRDVRWSALGYELPAGVFDYVFNAIGYWHSDNIESEPLMRLYFREEKPTESFLYAFLNAQEDSYLDSFGNLHILYHIEGESTNGNRTNHHAILAPDGTLIKDAVLPNEIGDFVRVFQDAQERFYILGSAGVLYPAGNDGVTLGLPQIIDLGDYYVEYSGFGISVPRTGTPISNILDVVFPTENGTKWIYFQLTLPEQYGSK